MNDSHSCIEGKFFVCGGEVVGAIMLAIGREATDPFSAIPRSDPFLDGHRLGGIDLNFRSCLGRGRERAHALAT